MGRPINKRYIGNVSIGGQQIEATAYFIQNGGPAPAYIAAQKATNTYNFVSLDGQFTERLELTNGGVALQPGQANITVQPYGSTGCGATATANLGVQSFSLTSGGSGTTTNGYIPGQILSMNGGTPSGNDIANATVLSVTLGAARVTTDTGYTVGDTFTWNYAGWTSPTVLTVASTSGNGNISGVTITNAGSVYNSMITNTTPFSSSVKANAWATSAAFQLRWDVSSINLLNAGDYTSLPSNPVSFTAQSGHGTGAEASASYGISSVKVTRGGTNYQAVNVITNPPGNAIIYGNIGCGGSVSELTVVAPGTFGPTIPTLTVAPIASTEYADVIRNLTVTTFNYNTYEWVPTGTVPQPGQAVLQSA